MNPEDEKKLEVDASSLSIEELLPHRGRMKLVDEILELTDDIAVTVAMATPRSWARRQLSQSNSAQQGFALISTAVPPAAAAVSTTSMFNTPLLRRSMKSPTGRPRIVTRGFDWYAVGGRLASNRAGRSERSESRPTEWGSSCPRMKHGSRQPGRR